MERRGRLMGTRSTKREPYHDVADDLFPFLQAQPRGKRLCSLDKNNVLLNQVDKGKARQIDQHSHSIVSHSNLKRPRRQRRNGLKAAFTLPLAVLISVEVVSASLLPRGRVQRRTDGSTSVLRRDGPSPSSSSSSSSSNTPLSSSSTPSDPHVSVQHNLPLQLLIVIGSIVLFSMFVGSLAWLCRTGCGKDRKRRRRRKTWSPGRGGSTTSDSVFTARQSIASLDLNENRSYSLAKDLGPYSPLPKLKDSSERRQQEHGRNRRAMSEEKNGYRNNGNRVETLAHMPELPAFFRQASDMVVGGAVPQNPTPAFQGARRSARGWDLFDGPVPGSEQDMMESGEANVPPARRPSFIERLLAHRSAASELPSQLSGEDPRETIDRLSQEVKADRKRIGADRDTLRYSSKQRPLGLQPSGSALLSVLSGSLHVLPTSIRNATSRNHTPRPLRKNKASTGMVGGDSDFEGTIGALDADIPMARRIAKTQQRFACDASSESEEFPISSTGAANQTPNKKMGTPRTPGIAGVGSVWHRRSVPPATGVAIPPAVAVPGQGTPRPPTLAELKRQQTFFDTQVSSSGNADSLANGGRVCGRLESTIARWMQASWMAEPVPHVLSRQGSLASDVFAAAATTKKQDTQQQRLLQGCRQKSSSDTLTPSVQDQNRDGMDRVPSLRPHFAATTTLDSWLHADQRAIQEEGEGAGMSSLLDQYFDEEEEEEGMGKGQRRKKMLWEKESEVTGLSGNSIGQEPLKPQRTGVTNGSDARSITLPPSYRTNPSEHSAPSRSYSYDSQQAQKDEMRRDQIERPQRAETRRQRARDVEIDYGHLQAHGDVAPMYEDVVRGEPASKASKSEEKKRYKEARRQERQKMHRLRSSGEEEQRQSAALNQWTAKDEACEEERRKVDRRLKEMKKEKRKAEKKLAKLHARQLALNPAEKVEQEDLSAGDIQKRRHTVLELASQQDEPEISAGLQRSQSMDGSVYSSMTAPSEYLAPVLSQSALTSSQAPSRSRAASNPHLKTKKSIDELSTIKPKKAPWLSPPESPLTSATEQDPLSHLITEKSKAFLIEAFHPSSQKVTKNPKNLVKAKRLPQSSGVAKIPPPWQRQQRQGRVVSEKVDMASEDQAEINFVIDRLAGDGSRRKEKHDHRRSKAASSRRVVSTPTVAAF